MADLLYTDVVPDVLSQAMGCPHPMVIDALRRSSQQFFRESQAYFKQIDAVPLVAGTNEYSLVGPSGTTVVNPAQVFYGSQLLARESTAFFLYSDPDYPMLEGTPTHFSVSLSGSLLLYPVPDAAAVSEVPSLSVIAVLIPSDVSVGILDYVFAPWREAIVSGALARLLVHVNKPWSNPAMAKYHGGRYKAGVKDAYSQAVHTGSRQPERVQFVRFGI